MVRYGYELHWTRENTLNSCHAHFIAAYQDRVKSGGGFRRDQNRIQSKAVRAASSRSCQNLSGTDRLKRRFTHRLQRRFGKNAVTFIGNNRSGNLAVRPNLETNCCFSFNAVSSGNRWIGRECRQRRHSIGVRIDKVLYGWNTVLRRHVCREQQYA